MRRFRAALCASVAVVASPRSQQLAIEPLVLQGMPTMRVTQIRETADGRMWFAGSGGLWVHDGEGIAEVSVSELVTGPHRLRCITPLDDGGLLVGLDRGLARVPRGTRELELLPGTEWVTADSLTADGRGGAWLASVGGLLRLSADGQVGAVPLPAADCAAGVHYDRGRLWVWSAKGVWTISIDTPGAAWQQLTALGAADAALYGQRLVTVGEHGVAALDSGGGIEWLRRGDSGTGIAVTGDAIWLRGADSALLRVLPGELQAREVNFFHRRSPLQITSISALHCDRSGLLWLGSAGGVWRVEPAPGIDNCVLPGLEHAERVTAFAELPDGLMVIGTSEGRLLQAEDLAASRWRTTPGLPFGNTRISVLRVDPHGRLWAGTRRAGLWRREGHTWRKVAVADIGDNVRDLCEHGGDMIVCGAQLALRVRRDDRGENLPFADPDDDGRMLPSCLAVGTGGDLWLGTYKNGLHRWDQLAGCFRRVALAGEGVLRIAPTPDGDRVLAVGVGQVYLVDTAGVARRVPMMEHGAPIRELLLGADGELWGARPAQLMQRVGAELLELGVSHGAHPLGYAFGGGTPGRNGDVWFGASRGYTRVHPAATLRSAERAQLTGFQLIGAGGASSWHRPGETVAAQPGFRIEPQIVARLQDLPMPWSVRLESTAGVEVRPDEDGAFRGEVGQSYRAVADFTEVTGANTSRVLGTLVVHAAPGHGASTIVIASAGLLLLGLLGLLGWRSRRNAKGVEPTVLVDTLIAIGQDPDSVLDLAFMVAAAAERGKAVVQASTASVWIRVPEQRDTLLLTFGTPAPGAGVDLDRSPWSESPAGRGVSESDRQVMIRLPGPAGIEFVVSLSGLPRAERGRSAELDAALAPARATLERRIWLERLQSSYVKSSLSLEAHLHDMRSALTSLRLGVGELREQHGTQDPVVQSVGCAMDALLQAVEALRSRDTVELAPCDPSVIVTEVVESVMPQALRRGLRVEVSGVREVGGVRLDPVWFRRALENTIGNALKYSPDGSRVEVALRLEPDRFMLSVDDQGPGIGADERKWLFRPGVVGKAPPRNGETKTGIGLWISRQALRAMGGTMWIEPRPQGGTRVVMQLPREAAASPAGQ